MAKLKLTYPVFRHAPSVTCGSGSLRGLAAESQLERTLFLTTGSPVVLDLLGQALARARCVLGADNHLIKPAGEPDTGSLDLAAAFIQSRPHERIVAVGGGSVLDWARLAWASSAGLLNLEDGRLQGQGAETRPRIWLVPTTCGTGAEAADVAVYLRGGRKTAVVCPAFMADRVILDGSLLAGLEPSQQAGFVCDTLSHALEGCLSLVPVSLGKQAGLSALHMMLRHFPAQPGSSRNDRLLEASFQGGVAAANCSVGIVHAFAHALGPDGLAHGLGNACALISGLRYNAETAQMGSLLESSGFASVEALIGAVKPMVSSALAALPAASPLEGLADPARRSEIANRMLADVAIRTNPRRPSGAAELEAWLLDVQQTVASL